MKHCLSMLDEVDSLLLSKERILIASDFDGTLCPIVDRPDAARLPPETAGILLRADKCSRLMLAVISGRALDDIRTLVPSASICAGNHGLEISGAGFNFFHHEAGQSNALLRSACETLSAALLAWPAAWVEQKGLSATLHFRQVAESQHRPLLLAATRSLSVFGSRFALHAAKRALEIRPSVQWDKGAALEYIRERAGPFDACICLGDDRTDESMFLANSGQLNVRVGRSTESTADCYVSDPREVATLLSHVVDVCNSGLFPKPRIEGLFPAHVSG